MKRVILCSILALAALTTSPAGADLKWPFQWSFVEASATCMKLDENHRPYRIKAVSPVFAYCYPEIPEKTVQADADFQLRMALNLACDGLYEITYRFISMHSSPELAEKDKQYELQNPFFRDHIEFAFVGSYYSSTCR